MNAAGRSSFVYVTYIRTTPEKLWAALTDPQVIPRYRLGTTITWSLILSNLKSLLETGEVAVAAP
jgi:hypothetical protein